MNKPLNSGIYTIRNSQNGKVYVGSAVNLRVRLRHHRERLNAGHHENSILQRAWVKYGADSFEFAIIERVSSSDLLIQREQFWIDNMKAADRDHGYNICRFAGSQLGTKRSAESREKMSAWQRGRVLSPEHREKLSMALKGRVISEETRRKLVIANTGRAPEIIEKTASAHRGMKRSAETRARLSMAAKNRGPISEETRAKISATSKGRKRTPEAIAKMVATKRALRAVAA